MDPFSSLLPELERVDRTIAARLAEFDLDTTDVRALSYVGGKRIRARLLIHSTQALLAEVPEAAIRLAAAVELIHLASLIHDDIIDGALTRRGRSASGLRALAAYYADRAVPRPTEASARVAAEEHTAAKGGQPAGVLKGSG